MGTVGRDPRGLALRGLDLQDLHLKGRRVRVCRGRDMDHMGIMGIMAQVVVVPGDQAVRVDMEDGNPLWSISSRPRAVG
jgi:hypothetical protein